MNESCNNCGNSPLDTQLSVENVYRGFENERMERAYERYKHNEYTDYFCMNCGNQQ